jgi:hypothetical protein
VKTRTGLVVLAFTPALAVFALPARDVSQMLIQPFTNENLLDGWYLSSVPIITASWKASSGNQGTVPVGRGAGKPLNLGKPPVNAQSARFYVRQTVIN